MCSPRQLNDSSKLRGCKHLWQANDTLAFPTSVITNDLLHPNKQLKSTKNQQNSILRWNPFVYNNSNNSKTAVKNVHISSYSDWEMSSFVYASVCSYVRSIWFVCRRNVVSKWRDPDRYLWFISSLFDCFCDCFIEAPLLNTVVSF